MCTFPVCVCCQVLLILNFRTDLGFIKDFNIYIYKNYGFKIKLTNHKDAVYQSAWKSAAIRMEKCSKITYNCLTLHLLKAPDVYILRFMPMKMLKSLKKKKKA